MKLRRTFVALTDSFVTSTGRVLGYVIYLSGQCERAAHTHIHSSNQSNSSKQRNRSIMSSQNVNPGELDEYPTSELLNNHLDRLE